MRGSITIKISEKGYAFDCDLDDVNLQGKLELMHAMSQALQMTTKERACYFLADSAGVLDDAVDLSECASDEELESLLTGGKTNES